MQPLVLVCERGGRLGARFPVEPVTTLGRAPGVEVQVDPAKDPLVSGRHASLVLRDGQAVLTDLGSTNGTFVLHSGAWRRLEGELALPIGARFSLGSDGPVFALEAEVVGTQVAAAPLPGRTGLMKAYLAGEVARSTRVLRWGLALLVLVFAGGAAVLVQTLLTHRDTQDAQAREAVASRQAFEARAEALQRDLDATRADLTTTQKKLDAAEAALTGAGQRLASTAGKLTEVELALTAAEGSSRRKLEAQAQDLTALKTRYEVELQHTQEAVESLRQKEEAATSIARRYEMAVFMLVVVHPDHSLDGFCTAFAVEASGLLATNAHCVEAAEGAVKSGRRVVARMNKRPDQTWRVVNWSRHKDYDGSAFSEDVGLVRLELTGELPVVVPVASWLEVIALGPGQPIYTLGFPGKVMNPDAPSADLRAAVISRVTDFENSTSMPGSNRMVWHSALTTKGTSGSPIFDAKGRVVAVNNGVLSARKIVVRGDNGRLEEDIGYDANGLNFGVRADALTELLEKGL